MFVWAKDVYLSIFLIFFRLSRWKGEMRSSSASIAVSVILGMLISIVWGEAQIALHERINLNRWLVISGLALAFGLNAHVLRKAGAKFEQRFRTFAASKQLGLQVAAVLIVVSIVSALFASISSYHRAFGITPR